MDLSYTLELGGFAENLDVIDGDFQAFNYCLAEEYAHAMYEEDFASIGDIDTDMLDSICYWLNYDGRHDNERLISDIKSGNLITNNRRSLIDAIYDTKNSSLAETYLNYGVYSPKLVLTIVLDSKSDAIANIDVGVLNQEQFTKRVDDLHRCIEEKFLKQENKEDFLLKVWEGFGRVKYESQFKCSPVEIEKYQWAKSLKKKLGKENK